MNYTPEILVTLGETEEVLRVIVRTRRVCRELLQALEAIRCNSEPDTLGTLCDLPEETEPHTREQHLEAQIRMLNQAARAAYEQGAAQL